MISGRNKLVDIDVVAGYSSTFIWKWSVTWPVHIFNVTNQKN
jgi:hypothetical protein